MIFADDAAVSAHVGLRTLPYSRGDAVVDQPKTPAGTLFYLCTLLYVSAIYLRPGDIIPQMAAVPYVQVLAALTVVAAALTVALEGRSFFDVPIDVCVLGFWIAIVVSNLSWGWLGGAISGITDFTPAAFCYVTMRLAIQTRRRLTGFVWLLVLVTVIQAVNAIAQHFYDVGLGGVTPLEDGRVRGVGIFNDPNDLALVLVAAVPLVMSALVGSGRRFLIRVGGAVAVTCLVVAIYYTESRGGLLGLAVALIASVYWRFGKLPAGILAAAAIALLIAGGPGRITEIDSEEDSAQGRIEAWSEGLEMLKERPVFGVGFGRFTEFHELVAHNSLVHVCAELGLTGGMFFMGIWYWYLRGVDSSGRPRSDPPPWEREIRATGLGVLMCMVFLSRQYSIVFFVLVGLAGCLAGIYRSPRDTSEDSPQERLMGVLRHVGVIAVLLATGIVAVKIAIVLFRISA